MASNDQPPMVMPPYSPTPSPPSPPVMDYDSEMHQQGELREIMACEYYSYSVFEQFTDRAILEKALGRLIATLPGMKERTITISGLSKTFSITGWRVGYCYLRCQVGPDHRLFQ